jgi:hypothetical protein
MRTVRRTFWGKCTHAYLLSNAYLKDASPLTPSYCNKFSPSLKMLRCVLIPPQEAVMCPPPPSGCCDTLLRLRTMRCVLLHGQAAAQAGIAKKVDQHPRPQPEDVAHACEEAAHHLPYTVVLLKRQVAVMCSPPPPGSCVTYHTLRHRMMQRVLPDAQVAAQAGKAKKVDPNPLPPPGQVSPSLAGNEDVFDGLLVTDEAPHHQPPYTVQVFPSLPGGDDVCDGQVVTDEQGGIVISVFLLYHIRIFILRRFFPQLLPSSLSHLGKPPPPTPSQDQYIPCPTNLLHIPQPPLSIVRVRNTTVWSLYTPRQCVYAMPCVSPRPCSAVECQSAVSQ